MREKAIYAVILTAALLLAACGGGIAHYPETIACKFEAVIPASISEPVLLESEPKMLLWQDAFADLLRAYSLKGGQLFFLLHDFDKSGIPELIIVGKYEDEMIDIVYAFRDGEVLRLEYERGVQIAGFALSARAGVIAPPDGVPGLITYITGASAGGFGSSSGYTMIVIDEQKLIRKYGGARSIDFHALNELFDDMGRGAVDNDELDAAIREHTRWIINNIAVSEKEFDRIFGRGKTREEYRLSPLRITEKNINAKLYGLVPVVLTATKGECWSQALLGEEFVRSRMTGDTLKDYVRVVEGSRAYELFVTTHASNNCWECFETWVFVSQLENGVYHYIDSFEIEGMIRNFRGDGFIIIDVDFDGVNDVLVWLYQGRNSMITAFVNRGDSYVKTNFTEIPNPSVEIQGRRIRGSYSFGGMVRGWSVNSFINDEFVRTDFFVRDFCRDTMQYKYIITLQNGEPVSYTFWYDYDSEQIYDIFYSENSIWNNAKWQWIEP